MDTTAPHWQPLKKFLFTYPSLFDGSGQNKTNELLKDVLEDMMADMKAHGGQAADMREVTENWSFRTFYASLTGKVLPADDEQIVKFKAMVLGFCSFIGEGESAKMDMFPWIRFFGGSTFAKMERIVQLKQQLWDNMWREALQQPLDVESPTCLVQAMRGLVDTKSPNFDPIFTEAMLKTLFFDFTMGGSPHVAKLSYALLNILLHHPDVLQRLQAEVDAVTNKSSRRPTLGDVDKMPYSTAVVNELLRYVSIVPMPVRRTLEETSLAGYTIPAGHIVVFNCFAINHEESFWGDPWNFRPERFLDDQGLHLPATHANMQHMLAFGDGLRRCPARSYPWKQLFLFTTYVAQTFDVLPDDKSGLVPYDCRNYTFELVLQPPSFFAKLVPRNV
jgi:cytochrome P450